MIKIFSLYVFIASISISTAVHSGEFQPVTYPNSELRPVHSESNGKDYDLFVQLPKTYSEVPKATFPLIVVSDSRFAFPITSGAVQLMGDRVIKDAIVVGVSYAKGDDYGVSRTRDYTPTYSPKEASAHSDEARAASGHAKEYVQFLQQQVIPIMLKNYRVDASNKIFVGHSFGGLLGAYILTNEPNLFDHYIIGSPSLWYDNNVILRMEKEYAKKNRDLKANVMMYVDADDSGTNSMVTDLQVFEQALRLHNYKSLNLHVEILKGETHHSVFPALLSKGLVKAIPLKP